MNTAVDSDTWTGMSPYAMLTDRERVGEVQFGASSKLLLGGAAASVFFFGSGVLLIALEAQGYEFSGRNAAALNLPILKAAIGCLLVVVGLAIVPGWWRRWQMRYSIVPLIVTDHDLRFGTPSQSIELSAITKITFRGLPDTLAELARVLSPRVGGSRTIGDAPLGPLLLSTQGQAGSIKLDLTALKGTPARIGLIICDRIQTLQLRAANANV
jgi:hypothetical protein